LKSQKTTSRKPPIRSAVNDPVYVYCAVAGRPSSRLLATLPSMPHGAPPRALPLTDDIVLIASDVPAAEYRADAIEPRLSDLDWVASTGTAHHAVVDALGAKHTVVPFRLFTLFTSEERALTILGRTTRAIGKSIERVRGKSEWVLRISKPDPARAEPARQVTRATPASGTAFLARKAAAKKAAVDVAARVRRDSRGAFAALDAIADQSSQRAIDQTPGLLLDAAFLVGRRQESAFKRALTASADGLLRDGCRVSLTGPWPPYSFVTLATGASRG
jgi:hypothetical protein